MKIYTARRTLSPQEKEAWGLHNLGMAEYHDRNFTRAMEYFGDVLKVLPDDKLAPLFLERSARFAKTPPPEGWAGADIPRAS
jgi:adenylate cyclase